MPTRPCCRRPMPGRRRRRMRCARRWRSTRRWVGGGRRGAGGGRGGGGGGGGGGAGGGGGGGGGGGLGSGRLQNAKGFRVNTAAREDKFKMGTGRATNGTCCLARPGLSPSVDRGAGPGAAIAVDEDRRRAASASPRRGRQQDYRNGGTISKRPRAGGAG